MRISKQNWYCDRLVPNEVEGRESRAAVKKYRLRGKENIDCDQREQSISTKYLYRQILQQVLILPKVGLIALLQDEIRYADFKAKVVLRPTCPERS